MSYKSTEIALDYYMKGLSIYARQDIISYCRNEISETMMRYFLERDDGYRSFHSCGFNDEQIKIIGENYAPKFIKVNELMQMNGRPPLFQNPYDSYGSAKQYFHLMTRKPEEELAEEFGCTYQEYVPDHCLSILLMDQKHPFWYEASEYALKSSWSAGPYLCRMMRSYSFKDWERVILAVDDGKFIGYCTFTEKDEMPEDQPYSPFVGFVYVDEAHRGNRVSEQMIEKALLYAKELGYKDIYLMSSEEGLYEKYGFEKMGEFRTIFDTADQLYRKSTD